MNRSARLTLAFALALLLLSGIQLAYRYRLPTDGWDAEFKDLDELNWLYLQDLTGQNPAIRPDDELIRVGDVTVAGTASGEYLSPPAGWEIGAVVPMTFLRDGQEVYIDVEIHHWTLGAVWQRNAFDLDKVISLPVYLLLFAIGLYTFLKRSELATARALLLISTTLLAVYISTLLPDGLSAQFDLLAFAASWFYNYSIVGTLLAPALLAFALHFPNPKQAIRRRPWLGLAPYLIGAVLALTLYILPPESVYIGWVSTMGMVLLTIASLVHAYFTQRDAVSRAQLRWVIGGFVFSLSLLLMAFPPAFGWIADTGLAALVLSLSFSLAFILMTLSIAIAVLRYRLFDIDVIIRRTLQYTLLTGLLALIYFGGVVILENLLRPITGDSNSPLVTVITTLGIAALFSPLRIRIQAFIDRRFFRRKYNAEQALEAFAAITRSEVDIERLSDGLLGLVSETMQPDRASLWLRLESLEKKAGFHSQP